MNRFVRIPIAVVACVVWAGLALAQAPPPATARAGSDSGAPPGAPQGPGRGGFVPVPVVIGPPAPVPPAGRDSSSDVSRAGAGQRRRQEVHRQRHVLDETAAEKVRIAVDAAAGAPERRRNLHADGAEAGPEARGVRRDGQARKHRSAAARRLDHRLVGAGRRQQGDVRQVLSAAMRTANFAVAGDTTQGVLWGLRNGEGQGFQPRRSC